MPIVRMQLKEIVARRALIKAEKIKLGKLKNNISITDIRELKQQKTERKAVIFEYTFKTDYLLSEPKNKSLGEIKIIGEIIYVDQGEVIDKILKEWEKSKKIKGNIFKIIINAAFEDAQIEALEQSKKVGLPPPVPLMRFKG